MRETQQITPHCHFGNKKTIIYLLIEARDGNLQNLDEIIGEAAKHIPFENKKHPDTPWKEMAGMCDN